MHTDPSFRMTASDVFAIKGRGVVVLGKVESGEIRVGDEIYFNSPSGVQKIAVTGLEMFHKQIPQAVMGDTVGVLLEGLSHGDLKRGDVISGSDADYTWS